MTAGVMWPSSIAVRVRGEQSKEDADKSSETAEASSTLDYDKFLDAANTGSLEVVNKYLLDPDLDVNFADDTKHREGQTALYKASRYGHSNVVRRLLRHTV